MALEFAAQWLHIALGIFWFGSVMFSDFVLGPGLMRMSAAGQREFGVNVGSRIPRVMEAAAIGVILVGIVRGTVLGDIHSLDDLGTSYGIAWLVSLVAGVFLLFWGILVTSPSVEKLGCVPEAEAPAMVRRTLRNAWIELAGFVLIFTAMIVMHFA